MRRTNWGATIFSLLAIISSLVAYVHLDHGNMGFMKAHLFLAIVFIIVGIIHLLRRQ